jgi:hypothetical protein
VADVSAAHLTGGMSISTALIALACALCVFAVFAFVILRLQG